MIAALDDGQRITRHPVNKAVISVDPLDHHPRVGGEPSLAAAWPLAFAGVTDRGEVRAQSRSATLPTTTS
jgi:hypothetical protein